MNATWLVLANASSAQIYKLNRANHKDSISDPIHHLPKHQYDYQLMHELFHKEGQMKGIDLLTDRPGHYKTSTPTRGAFAPQTDIHEIERKHFAKEIMHLLHKSHQDNHFERLILCAEPHFYGLLEKNLSNSLAQSVYKSIKKDLIPAQKTDWRNLIEKLIEN